jgi:omega-6 fatty acid desaturase (delta-12 desaturase)
LTVCEYRAASRCKRFAYRVARNPQILFVIAPLYVFAIHHRFSSSAAPERERRSVRRTNIALLAATLAMSALIGLKLFLQIQLTVSACAGALTQASPESAHSELFSPEVPRVAAAFP